MSNAMRSCLAALVAAFIFVVLAVPARAQQNSVLGEVRFDGGSKIDKTSGVWIDGQYLGFVSELKGDKKVLLMPGDHQISVRQSGYQNSDQKITIEPGQIYTVHVKMQRDPRVQYSSVTSEIKLAVTPERAAVFVDDVFVGHVSEFGGTGRAMLVSPGAHKVRITLPGYQTFETDLKLLPKQKFELKTDLAKGTIADAGPDIKEQ
jgi:PEGA domain